MIDTSSVESFINTLPKKNKEACDLLSINIHKSANVPKSIVSIAKRGYLGSIPVAKSGTDDIVIRILPLKELSESPVAFIWKGIPEGFTIAPGISYFIATLMAHRDISEVKDIDLFENQKSVIELANDFGDNGYCKNIFDRLVEIKKIGQYTRFSYMMGLIDTKNDFFDLISKLWKPGNLDIEKKKWIKEIYKTHSDNVIIMRLYTSLAPWVDDKKSLNISEVVNKLLQNDDTFDQTYSAINTGLRLRSIPYEPLVEGIEIIEKEGFSIEEIDSDLWEAATQYASNPLKYDGEKHLSYAKRIAKNDPIQAYIQTCNAAAYYARSKKKPPVEAINFAYELARENKWQHLETILKWTVEGIDE